jgi:hypothetical protein
MTGISSIKADHSIIVFKPNFEAIDSKIDKKIDEVMKISLHTAIFFKEKCSRKGIGKIYILLGVSSSGRNEIIKKLLKISSDWTALDIEYEAELNLADFIKSKFKSYYDQISKLVKHKNIGKLFLYNKRKFKDKVDMDQLNAFNLAFSKIMKKLKFDEAKKVFDKDSLAYQLLDKLINNSLEGKNCIVKMPYITFLIKYLMQHHVVAPIRIGITYCPLESLVKRVAKKNLKGFQNQDFANVVQPSDIIKEFTSMYMGVSETQIKTTLKLSNIEKWIADNCLDSISEKQLEKICWEFYDEESNYFSKSLIHNRITEEEFLSFSPKYLRIKTILFQNLGIISGIKEVNILPKCRLPHDTLNTMCKIRELACYINSLEF